MSYHEVSYKEGFGFYGEITGKITVEASSPEEAMHKVWRFRLRTLFKV